MSGGKIESERQKANRESVGECFETMTFKEWSFFPLLYIRPANVMLFFRGEKQNLMDTGGNWRSVVLDVLRDPTLLYKVQLSH